MLGRYRVEAELGQGLGGVVYRAFDTTIERTVAIKCLRKLPPKVAPGGTHIPRDFHFEEAKVIGQLNHPHITAIYDTGAVDGLPYIVMEYVEGETLKVRLGQTQSDPATVPQVLSFVVMVARALHYVHQRGILHGDIKPANLIVTPQGTPKIMDFGIARRSHTTKSSPWSVTLEDEIAGTLGYLAPEQFTANEIDARADVFSLGVIAYQWLARRLPFQNESVEANRGSVLRSRPPPLSELGEFDPDLSAAIDQALARNPADRFDSADAMADALEICQERGMKLAASNDQPHNADTQPSAFPRLKGRNLLFADFSEADIASVMQLSRRETYEAGATIVQEGAGGSTMYVVTKGRASVRKTTGAKQVEIKTVSRGECFGEMAIISQRPRSASVVAVLPTEVIAISGAVLRSANHILCMKLYRNIASLLADRVRQKDDQVVDLLDSGSEGKSAKRFFPFW